MSNCPTNVIITVSVDDDGMAARLSLRTAVQSEAPSNGFDPEAIAVIARDREKVDVDGDVLAHIAEAIRAFRADGCAHEQIIAEGAPATDGADGWVEWVPGCDPSTPGASLDTEGAACPIDHYNRVRYVCVREGVHVATIHPPAAGEPGRDVCGGELSSNPGHPCPIKLEKGLRLEDSTRVVAEADGMLELTGDVLKVSRLLDVNGSVDFSTGNIDFDGSITIADGIQDLFEVRTTESIVIEGVAGAAYIEAGGNVVCRHGIVGKQIQGEQHGRLYVGGQAEIGYLHHVHGDIAGDLLLQREAFSCHLTVHGRLLADDATVIGGDSYFGRGIHAGELGNERGSSATLVIGSVARMLRAHRRRERLERQLDDLKRQRDQALRTRSSKRHEFVHALDLKLADQEQQIQSAREDLEALESTRGDAPPSKDLVITVRRALHPGVRLLVDDLEISPLDTISGPIELHPQNDDLPHLLVGGARRDITTCLRIRRRCAGEKPTARPSRKAG